jgi:hypothetical protein
MPSKRDWKKREVLLRPYQDAALEDAALQEGWTVSVLVRLLISRYLKNRRRGAKCTNIYRENDPDKSRIH